MTLWFQPDRYGCHALASKGWCTLKYGRDDPWPVLEDWFLRAQMATLLDNEEAEQDMDNFDAIDELKSGGAARRSSSLQYTPILKDDNSDEMIDNENLWFMISKNKYRFRSYDTFNRKQYYYQ